MNAGKDIGFAILIAIGPYTKINFARILVGLESLSNTCNADILPPSERVQGLVGT